MVEADGGGGVIIASTKSTGAGEEAINRSLDDQGGRTVGHWTLFVLVHHPSPGPAPTYPPTHLPPLLTTFTRNILLDE